MEITFLEQKPLVVHKCHRGNCKNAAKYTLCQDGKPIANMCLHHASRFCDKNDLKMPLMDLEQMEKSFGYLNDTLLPLIEKIETNEGKRQAIEASVATDGITKEEGDLLAAKFGVTLSGG